MSEDDQELERLRAELEAKSDELERFVEERNNWLAASSHARQKLEAELDAVKRREAAIRGAATATINGTSLREYILEQFPATDGHRPLVDWFTRLDASLATDAAPCITSQSVPIPPAVQAAITRGLEEGTKAAVPMPHRYELWKHLHDEYGLLLLESELEDIVQAVTKSERVLTREQVLPLVEAIKRCKLDFTILVIERGDLADEPRAHETLRQVESACAHAKALGF
jgi:hypothetical protein